MNRKSGTGHRRRVRITLCMLFTLLAGTLLLPLGGYWYVSVYAAPVEAAAGEGDSPADQAGVNPRSNYWRAVRQGEQGYTSASGPSATANMIVSRGEEWRQLRNGYVTWGITLLVSMVLLLILLYHFIKGPKRLEQPPSGRMLPRWSGGERLLHWYTAILFILMAITGFSLLFGRAVLVPLLGLEGFAAYAGVAKVVHNFGGPLFLVGVIIEVVTWMRFNTFKSHDWVWLKSAGGMWRKGEHPPAGRTNGGEKVWFWFIASAGLLGVGISGLVLDFPNFGQGRETMQLANLIHSSLAGLWLAIAFGHIYLGTLGVPGTFRGMSRGYVSEEWMKEHHNLWYEQLQGGREPGPGKPAEEARPSRPGAEPVP